MILCWRCKGVNVLFAFRLFYENCRERHLLLWSNWRKRYVWIPTFLRLFFWESILHLSAISHSCLSVSRTPIFINVRHSPMYTLKMIMKFYLCMSQHIKVYAWYEGEEGKIGMWKPIVCKTRGCKCKTKSGIKYLRYCHMRRTLI